MQDKIHVFLLYELYQFATERDSAHLPTGDIKCGVFKQASVTGGWGLTFHEGRPQSGRTATPKERGGFRHPHGSRSANV